MSSEYRPETVELTPSEVEAFWRAEDLELSTGQQSLLPEIRRWLGRRKHNSLADFLVGESVETLSPEITKELTADVLARFRPQSRGVEALSLLTKLIDRGNAESLFILCPPSIATLTKREPSPFTASRWPAIGTAPLLRDHLALSLESPKTERGKDPLSQVEARNQLGQMLLSACIHGGLISRVALEALMRALLEGNTPLQLLGGRVFVELSLSYKKQPNAEFRRWYPDPLTACLLMQLAPATFSQASEGCEPTLIVSSKFIWQCINTFLRQILPTDSRPRTLKALLDAAKLDLESRIPVYLAHYAAGAFVTHSVKPSVYRRLHGIAPDSEQHADMKPTAPRRSTPGRMEELNPRASGEVEPRWVGALRRVLRGHDRTTIVAGVKELLDMPAPGFMRGDTGELFAGFALRTFSITNENKVKHAVSTARAIVLSLSTRLGGLAGTSIEDFGSEEWSALYEEVLGDAESPGMRRKLARALREFQRFLEQERGADLISATGVFADADGLVPVDANIVTEAEFQRIREQFSAGANDVLPVFTLGDDGDRLAEAAWLILTFAYRCGLRRSEVLKLELRDLLVKHRATVLVRPTEARRLKTKSSTRRLPLHVLMTDEELQRLHEWVKRRKEDESRAPYSRFLFSVPGRGFQHVPEDGLFRLLHRVMRDVTGDPSLRFHHLRHSFASRTYLMLSASALRSTEGLDQALPGFGDLLQAADDFRERLFGTRRMTRRDIWAVCSLLGHSGPDVSCEHYIHHLDIVLAEALSAPDIAASRATVIRASGASSSQAYHHLDSKSMATWIGYLFRKRFPDRCQSLKDKTAVPDEASSSNTLGAATESLNRIWRLLLIAGTSSRSLEEIAERRHLPPERLVEYVENARYLRELKLSPTGQKLRHRWKEWIPDKRIPEQKVLLACPVKPHERRDLQVMERLGASFRAMWSKETKLFKDAVLLFATEARPDFGGVIFKDHDDPSAAHNFVRFLQRLGCEKNEIEFVSFDVTSKRSPHSAAWRRALVLHASIPIRKAAPPNGRRDWACPWLGIQPVFPDAHGKMMGSAGFRFVMIMGAIGLSSLSKAVSRSGLRERKALN